MSRLYNLDYLRGIAAFGIMIYHYTSWGYGEFSADTNLGRIGIYGVSIFYVLSGLTLHYVYFNRMRPTRKEIFYFVKKRIFRIFPLLWLVTILAIILSKQMPSYFNVFLNLSGLFGFVKWGTYFSVGEWSIGNELVFYTFFPFFILFTRSFKPLMVLSGLIIFAVYLYFSFIKLNAEQSLSLQWKNYVNPLNQVFLFLGGYLIGLFFQNINIGRTLNIFVLITGLVLFVFYPAAGDLINLVTGMNRLVFTLSIFLICIGFYKLTDKFSGVFHKPLTILGEASYSVYLLHPVVYTITGIGLSICGRYIFQFPESSILPISLVLTLILSYFVYQYFEKYFMKKGSLKKKVPAKLSIESTN